MSTPVLSVVLPLYRTGQFVPELVDRLAVALAAVGGVELVFVDDGCPEASYRQVPARSAGALSVVVLRHDRNRGQIAAVRTGLRRATGSFVAVMDTDLQDAPEDLPVLLDELVRSGGDAVAAGRRGDYEARGRMLTGRLYRRAVHVLSRGIVPPDAGLFMVMRGEIARRVVSLGEGSVHPVPALARLGARIATVAVDRRPRPDGSSSYGAGGRLTVAVRNLLVLTPAYPVLRWASALGRRAR